MELSKLTALLEVLRSHGVKRYAHEGLELELGDPAPAVPVAVDLNTTGFVDNADGRDPALRDLLKRLDPQYSDPALFDIR